MATKIYYPPASQPEPSSPEPTHKHQKLRALWLALGLVGVAMMSATAGALVAVSLSKTPLMQATLTAEEARVFDQGNISTNTTLQPPALTRPVNILLLGIKVLSSDLDAPPIEAKDLGYHALVNSFEGLSDTMLLLRFDPNTGQVVVLSIPRDTRTWVDGVGRTKLNEANAYGGPALAARSISELLNGVTIDRYVRINVQGVEKLVDALGGVTVYVPHDMKYQDDSQHLYINLKQGEQHLTGNEALQFLRFRYDRHGDIGRVQRQQMLMRAFMEQALSPATLTRTPQILSVIKENIDTNLSVEEILALGGFATQLNRSNVQMLMLPGSFGSPTEYGTSYWLPSHRRIDTLMSRYFGTGSLATGEEESFQRARIAIQDSTGNREAINHLIKTLRDAGYANVFRDDGWPQPLAVTRVVAQGGDPAPARTVQEALGIGEVRVESTGNLQSDITLQVGQDWLDYIQQQFSGSEAEMGDH